MSEQRLVKALEARLPSVSTLAYAEIGKDILKSSYARMNDTLRQLATINTFLLGGGAYLNPSNINSVAKAIGGCCFLGSLVAAFVGTTPVEVRFRLSEPDTIRAAHQETMRRKSIAFGVSVGLLVAGLATVCVGVVAK